MYEKEKILTKKKSPKSIATSALTSINSSEENKNDGKVEQSNFSGRTERTAYKYNRKTTTIFIDFDRVWLYSPYSI